MFWHASWALYHIIFFHIGGICSLYVIFKTLHIVFLTKVPYSSFVVHQIENLFVLFCTLLLLARVTSRKSWHLAHTLASPSTWPNKCSLTTLGKDEIILFQICNALPNSFIMIGTLIIGIYISQYIILKNTLLHQSKCSHYKRKLHYEK